MAIRNVIGSTEALVCTPTESDIQTGARNKQQNKLCDKKILISQGLEIIKPSSCSTQMSMKFQLLIKTEIAEK